MDLHYSNTLYSIRVFHRLADTYAQAKSFATKARMIDPMNYSENDVKPQRKRRQLNSPQNEMAEVQGALKIKVERVSNLKKALCFLNLQNDKRRIEDIDECDVEEYDVLLSEDETEGCPSPVTVSMRSNCLANPTQTTTIPMQSANNAGTANGSYLPVDPKMNATDGSECNDVIGIGSNGMNSAIRTGIDPLQTDPKFSLEYSFATEVSIY